MRRRFSVFGVAAVVAASLWAAAPAKAAESDSCEMLISEPVIVEIGPGTIDVYPGNVGPWAGHVLSELRAYVKCLLDETTGPAAACVGAMLANRPTVEIDIPTLHVSVEFGDFLSTACEI